MILVFGSSFFGQDRQNDIIKEALEESGKDHVFINPLSETDLAVVELAQQDKKTRLLIDGRECSPDVVYMSRLWRTDCILDLPGSCLYPTLYRHKVQAFLTEIRFALDSARWVPGRIEDIERAEAKIPLLHLASWSGLNTPPLTRNSFKDLHNEVGYRKSLGPPFTITFDIQEGVENAVTIFNRSEHDDSLGLPWQWQSPIEARAQIRSVVIGDSVRSYIADIAQFQSKDLREAQDSGIRISWEAYELPPETTRCLIDLCRGLKLTMCCPEFLIDAEGRHIFIDLNPCGDWCDWLDDEENMQIAKAIIQTL